MTEISRSKPDPSERVECAECYRDSRCLDQPCPPPDRGASHDARDRFCNDANMCPEVVRLRADCDRLVKQLGDVSRAVIAAGERSGVPLMSPPRAPEAADSMAYEVVQLRADRDRLREALADVINHWVLSDAPEQAVIDRAVEALDLSGSIDETNAPKETT